MDKNEILLSDLEDIKEILDDNGYAMWGKRIFEAIQLIKEQKSIINLIGDQSIYYQNRVIELKKKSPVKCKNCKHWNLSNGCNKLLISCDADWYCGDGERKNDE